VALHFDAAVRGVFDGQRGVKTQRHRVRREEIRDGIAAQRELIEIVVELHRRISAPAHRRCRARG
jgi:hypothetical protein